MVCLPSVDRMTQLFTKPGAYLLEHPCIIEIDSEELFSLILFMNSHRIHNIMFGQCCHLLFICGLPLRFPLAAEEECGKHSSLYFLRGLILFVINAPCIYIIFYDLDQIQTDTNGWSRYLVSYFPRVFFSCKLAENLFKQLPIQPHVSICRQFYTHF